MERQLDFYHFAEKYHEYPFIVLGKIVGKFFPQP